MKRLKAAAGLLCAGVVGAFLASTLGAWESCAPELALPQPERGVRLDGETQQLLEELGSSDPIRRGEAYVQLEQRRKVMVHALLDLAEREMQRERRATEAGQRPQWGPTSCQLAIDLLANVGIDEAAPFCVRHVDYFHPRTSNHFDTLHGYSCAQLLRSMNDGADWRVLEYLHATPPENVGDSQIDIFATLLTRVRRYPDGESKGRAVATVRRAVHYEQRRATRYEHRHDGNRERLLRVMERRLEKMYPNGFPQGSRLEVEDEP